MQCAFSIQLSVGWFHKAYRGLPACMEVSYNFMHPCMPEGVRTVMPHQLHDFYFLFLCGVLLPPSLHHSVLMHYFSAYDNDDT
jgi:hypothetical protein